MNFKRGIAVGTGIGLLTVAVSLSLAVGWSFNDNGVKTPQLAARLRPTPPAMAYVHSAAYTAPLEVAKVFGRSPGCTEASSDLIEAVAKESLRAGIDPRIGAATVAVESGCNQYAVSTKGALGLMQVQVKTWQGKYDFSKTNLLDRDSNLRVGTQVLASYIEKWGVTEGVHRYNGMGTNCDTCDAGYANKILSLAGSK